MRTVWQIFSVGIVVLGLFGFSSLHTAATAQSPSYVVGEVLQVRTEQQLQPDPERSAFQMLPGEEWYLQELVVERSDTAEEVVIQHGSEYQPLAPEQRLKPGDKIVLVTQLGMSEPAIDEGEEVEPTFTIADRYRLPALAWLLAGFVALVLVVSGWRGILPIAGMVVSLIVLMSFVVPNILSGANPMLVSLVGSVGIAAVTVYLSHGFTLKSHVALSAIIGTLLAVVLLAESAVNVAHLTGFGSEEASFLFAMGDSARINIQGLLLGGILLGALGVLDDITVSQVSTVFELRRANEKWQMQELYQAGMRVGRDHVASLVNTLVLAYAGANLPLFILFVLSEQTPSWVHLNSELLAEEVVRTLVGSIGLVLAVPVATLLAAIWAKQLKVSSIEEHQHKHAH